MASEHQKQQNKIAADKLRQLRSKQSKQGADAVRNGRERFSKDYIEPIAKIAGSLTPLGPVIGGLDAYNSYKSGNNLGAIAGAGLEALPYVGKYVGKVIKTSSPYIDKASEFVKNESPIFIQSKNSMTRGIGSGDAGLKDLFDSGIVRANPRGRLSPPHQFAKHFKTLSSSGFSKKEIEEIASNNLSESTFSKLKAKEADIPDVAPGAIQLRRKGLLQEFPDYASYKKPTDRSSYSDAFWYESGALPDYYNYPSDYFLKLQNKSKYNPHIPESHLHPTTDRPIELNNPDLKLFKKVNIPIINKPMGIKISKKQNGGNLFFLGGLTGATAVSGGGGLAGELSGMINTKSTTGGAASGALKGASMGSALGPYGMAAGALIGGATGFINSANQQKKDEYADFTNSMDQRNSMLGIKVYGGRLYPGGGEIDAISGPDTGEAQIRKSQQSLGNFGMGRAYLSKGKDEYSIIPGRERNIPSTSANDYSKEFLTSYLKDPASIAKMKSTYGMDDISSFLVKDTSLRNIDDTYQSDTSFLPDKTSLGNVKAGKVQAYYSPKTHSVVSNPYYAVHENAHASRMTENQPVRDAINKITEYDGIKYVNKYLKPEWSEYGYSPNEIYSRLMQWRYDNKIKPGTKLTPEDVIKIGKQGNDRDKFLDSLDEQTVADLHNKIAANKMPKTNKENNMMANGGYIVPQGISPNMMSQYAEGGLLTEFGAGGSHESSPQNGVPQGVAPNGEVNKVEEGETKYQDYIFSDRLKIDKQAVQEHNLPKSMNGISFADASKRVSKLHKERPNDPITRDTMKDKMNHLMQANDEIREYEEGNMMAMGGNLYGDGAQMNIIKRKESSEVNTGGFKLPPQKLESQKLFDNAKSIIANGANSDKDTPFFKDPKNLRYAPIAFDALAATGLFGKAPTPQQYSPSLIQQQGYLAPQQADEQSMRNAIDASYGTGVNAMSEAAGGSGAALRAGLSGLNADYMSSIGKAYSGVNQANMGQKQAADQFNLGTQGQIAGQNAQMMNQAEMYNNQLMNQKNAQDWDTRMSYLGKGAEGLGDIGYEARNAELMPRLFGYSQRGEYKPINAKACGGRLRMMRSKK